MNRRKVLVSAILTVITLFASGLVYNGFLAQKKSTVSAKKKKEDVRQVQTNQFPPTIVSSEVFVDGRTSAVEQIDLFAEVTGQLLPGKSYRKGSYFSKGDLLFEVDSQDDKYSVYAQRSALMNSITQIMPDLKFDYPDAFQKWRSYLDNFNVERNIAALPEVNSKQEKYFISAKNIYNQYYSIKGLEDRLAKHQIYAPFSGVFLSIGAFPGTLISPGLPLAKIMNTSQYEIEAPIRMGEIEYVTRGQELELYSEELDKTWKGRVSRVSNQIDQATQSIPVFISVSGKGLKDGIYLKGKLAGTPLENVSTIPLDAIVDQSYVFLVNDSLLVKEKIEILSRGEQSATARGLNGTEEVVIRGINSLYAGQKVGIQRAGS